MEDWGEEIFAEGVGVKWENERVGRGRKNTPARRACSFAKPVHQMDGASDWCGKLHACHLRSIFSSGRSAILVIWRGNGEHAEL